MEQNHDTGLGCLKLAGMIVMTLFMGIARLGDNFVGCARHADNFVVPTSRSFDNAVYIPKQDVSKLIKSSQVTDESVEIAIPTQKVEKKIVDKSIKIEVYTPDQDTFPN